MAEDHSPCPLCGTHAVHFERAHRRDYYRCPTCALIHVPPDQHLPREAEKAIYDQHDNFVDDPKYRRFLTRVAEPLMAEVPPPARALDFGCGHGPALAAMLEEAGYTARLYDPFYFPDPSPLRERYTIITATEVAEHLKAPSADLGRLWACLEPGGWLGIMTKRQPAPEAFADWHYLRDLSHIAFFHEQTFRWLAARWGAELRLPRGDVALLHKPADRGVESAS